MLREAVSGVARKYGYAYYGPRARAFEPPTELWDELGRLGYLGVNLPVEHGGGGLGVRELAIVLEETAAAGCPLNHLVLQAIIGSVLVRYGSREQQDRWLPGIAAGEVKCAFAITESDAGSNAHNIALTATRDGDRYLLNGSKTFCSFHDHADVVLVVARTGRHERTGAALLSLFLMPNEAPGLERQHIPTAPPVAAKSFQLYFDDVAVPAEDLVGTEHEGWRPLFDGLNPERIMGAAVANGIGRYALDKGSQYANDRAVWGAPIGTHQGIAHPLAEAKIELELARLMTTKAAALFDAGAACGEEANMAKLAAADASLHCVERAIQTHGGNGLALEFGLTDFLLIARLFQIAPVSREMILNHIAQHSLGLPKSY